MDWLLSSVQHYVSTETLIWLTVLSIIFFVGTLIAIPFILVRLPADYFDVLCRWDCEWYVRMAEEGYDRFPTANRSNAGN